MSSTGKTVESVSTARTKSNLVEVEKGKKHAAPVSLDVSNDEETNQEKE